MTDYDDNRGNRSSISTWKSLVDFLLSLVTSALFFGEQAKLTSILVFVNLMAFFIARQNLQKLF